MKLSVITPVYRSKNSITTLYEKISENVHLMSDFMDYEIVMIEDCGGDGSWELISQLASKDLHLKGIKLSRNFGQHHAIAAGMDICKGDWVIVMDCDLQDDPSAFTKLWQKAKEGYDVVNVRRQMRKDSFYKKVRSRIYHIIFEWLSGLSYDPQVANYRLMSRKVVDAYNTMSESSRVLGAQIHWLGYNTAIIDFPHAPRYDGKSSYTLKKLLALSVDVAISYSNKPLQIAIVIGFIVSLTSIGVALTILIGKLIWNITVTGWTSLMLSIWFLAGLIIAILGIIGIYIGKVYDEAKNRPIYVIDKKVNS